MIEDDNELQNKLKEVVGKVIDLFEEAGLQDHFVPICAAAIATSAKGPLSELCEGDKEGYYAGCITTTDDGSSALIYVDYDVLPFIEFCHANGITDMGRGDFVLLKKLSQDEVDPEEVEFTVVH